MKTQFIAIAIVLCYYMKSSGQGSGADYPGITLKEATVSVNNVAETRKTVSQMFRVLTAKDLEAIQAQTSADVLAQTGLATVQKSQQGGGSVVLRGFEASRVLLVVDGIRMNNIMYRAGHLQNLITLDNASLERVEVLYGPASTIYGSDALGGVVHLYTRKPSLADETGKTNFKVNAFTRLGSANDEFTGHFDFNIGCKKLASFTSFTYANFGDLKGGENQNPFYDGAYGERPYYVERINGLDSLVKNPDRYAQVQSGYTQYDVVQKVLYKPGEKISHGINLQYSTSGDIPRYDRLTDPSGSGLRYAEWYYGPQERLLAAYDLDYIGGTGLFQRIHLGVNYQNIEESRHTRRFNSNNLDHRMENANVLGTALNFQKVTLKHNLRFGLDAQYNTLKSTAERENIASGANEKLDTRYPDGNNSFLNAGLFYSHTWTLNDHFIITDGIRAGVAALHSTIDDTSFFHLPYSDVDQTNFVYSGSIGLIHNPTDDLKLSFLLSTGYRVPNVDDLSKIFESAPGVLVVPNSDLKPEKTINYEMGMTNLIGVKSRWENVVYYTRLYDAIVTDTYTYEGKDSLLYDGTLSRIYANQNKREAYLYGFSSDFRSSCSEHLEWGISLGYTYGRIKTDSSDSPLDHIPPFTSRFNLRYSEDKFMADFFINYNGWKRLKDYNLGGEDNEQYATPDGMPAWYTLNLHLSYKTGKHLRLQAGVDNIFDTQYRTFSSGINGPGRNFFAALRFQY